MAFPGISPRHSRKWLIFSTWATRKFWGQTPLIFAAAASRVETIRVLLEAGADPALASRSVNVVELEKADKAAEKRLSDILADFKEKEKGDIDWQPTPSQVQVAIEASRQVQRSWPTKAKKGDDGEEANPGKRFR